MHRFSMKINFHKTKFIAIGESKALRERLKIILVCTCSTAFCKFENVKNKIVKENKNQF